MSVRERNTKLLLEAVIWMATMEITTCIITIETVMCIMNGRKYHFHDCDRDSHLHNFKKKNVTRMFAAEIFISISVTELLTA